MPPSFQEAGRTVVFRVDASSLIGTGHVMRCLTLADELTHRGVRSVFLCRPHEGDLRTEVTQRGHGLVSLPSIRRSVVGKGDSVHEDWLGVDWRDDATDTLHALSALGATPDWLVVDHYAIDSRWERRLKPFVGRTMVIDDLADREHVCDLLLDQNLCLRMDIRYDDLIPSTTKRLLGPRYALVRDDFARKGSARRANWIGTQRAGIVRRSRSCQSDCSHSGCAKIIGGV